MTGLGEGPGSYGKVSTFVESAPIRHSAQSYIIPVREIRVTRLSHETGNGFSFNEFRDADMLQKQCNYRANYGAMP